MKTPYRNTSKHVRIMNNRSFQKIVIAFAAVIFSMLAIQLIKAYYYSMDNLFPEEQDLLLNGYGSREKLRLCDSTIRLYGSVNDYAEMCKAGKYMSLYYSFIMANKYQYAPACYNVYQQIIQMYAPNNKPVDSNSYNMAVFYLQKGAMLGDVSCIRELDSINKKK